MRTLVLALVISAASTAHAASALPGPGADAERFGLETRTVPHHAGLALRMREFDDYPRFPSPAYGRTREYGLELSAPLSHEWEFSFRRRVKSERNPYAERYLPADSNKILAPFGHPATEARFLYRF